MRPLVFLLGGLVLLFGSVPDRASQGVVSPSAVSLQRLAETPRVLRFRVIANSDNPYDQAVKIAVRNAVLAVLERRLTTVHSEAAAFQATHAALPRLKRVVSVVLRQDHVRYGSRVDLGTTLFPTKAYGTWLLPAGRYEALIIVLGRGQGHNWWCVLYPALCFIDLGTGLSLPMRETAYQRMDRLHVVWWIPGFLAAWLRRL